MAEASDLRVDRITATTAYATAALGGAVLWQLAAMLGGRREAWDSALYWTVAYPLGLVKAAMLGYIPIARGPGD